MLHESLKFVRGVAKKNRLAPELEHYSISGGRITAFNGYLAFSAKFDLDIEAFPKADVLSKAIEASGESVSIKLTKANRLSISSSGLRVFVPCLEALPFDIAPTGDTYEVPENFVEDLAVVAPFVGDDVSRPWASGVLLQAGLCMATNNVILIQRWNGHSLPPLNLPRYVVQELVRLGNPTSMQTDGSSITFHYPDERWVRAQLLAGEWPFEKLSSILEREATYAEVPTEFPAAVEKLRPFTTEKSSAIYFNDGGIATSREAEEGTHLELAGLPEGPCFSVHQLKLLSEVAEAVDWSAYPKPCLFTGKNLRGAVIGMSV